LLNTPSSKAERGRRHEAFTNLLRPSKEINSSSQREGMAVSIKAEGGDHPLLIDPKTELITGDTEDDETGGGVDFLDYAGDALEIVANGVGGLLGGKLAADTVLEKLPRPCSALNCRQARSYLVKLLRYGVPSVFRGLL
jgi:hypothetical protein